MKFSPMNEDFTCSSLSPDPLRLRRLAHVGVKEGYPLKVFFFRYCLV